PHPSPATVALFAIGLGLTIGSRIIGGMAALYAAAALGLIVVVEGRALGVRAGAARLGRFVLALLSGVVVSYLFIGLVWPWAVIDPLNPIRSLEYFSVFFEKPWKEMFGGQVIPVPDMPRSYVPTLFALKTPEVFLLLTMAGIIGAVIAAARQDVPLRLRATLVLLMMAGGGAVAHPGGAPAGAV